MVQEVPCARPPVSLRQREAGIWTPEPPFQAVSVFLCPQREQREPSSVGDPASETRMCWLSWALTLESVLSLPAHPC